MARILAAPLAAAAFLALALAGCTAPAPQAPADITATFYPLGYFAGRVAGDDLSVAVLVPAGTEPHDWEPSPQDLVRTEGSRVFVHNGAGLEPWATQLAARLAALPGRVVVEAAHGIELHAADHAHEEEGHADEAGHDAHAGEGAEPGGALDPHVWLDPVRAQAMVDNILAGVRQADPANATAHAERAGLLKAELARLDADFAQGLADCRDRDILTTHTAFGYLADRYNFTQHGIAGLSPEGEPSPAKLRELVDLARRLNVSHVFFEELVSPRIAQVIAGEVGAQTLVLSPVEGLSPEAQAAGEDYFSLMRRNLANLRTAMGCA